MTGIELITRERKEQLEKHGFSLESDLKYSNGELKLIAEYLLKESNDAEADELRVCLINGSAGIPFSEEFISKLDTKNKLQKTTIAGAFLAAEIDRLVTSTNNKLNSID